MNAVLPVALPYLAPRPAPDAGWERITHTLISPSGDEIDLTDHRRGLLLMRGVRGMGRPPFEHYLDELVSLPGSQWLGMVEKQRECFWPIYIYSDSTSLEWITNHQRFFNALQPRQESIWRVRVPQRGDRILRVRPASDGGHTYDLDPYYMGWASYGISLIAPSPFWEGEPITRTYKPADPQAFTGTLGGPPFFITPRNTIESATIPNPGDVDASIVWTVGGPQPSGATLGFGDYSIEVPFEIAEEEWLTIDTRPGRMVATMQDGTERTSELGPARDLGQGLPPGSEVALSLSATGTGPIMASLTPLYWSAL